MCGEVIQHCYQTNLIQPMSEGGGRGVLRGPSITDSIKQLQ